MPENQNTYFRDYDWLSLVLCHDPKHFDTDQDAYEFSNGRKFKSTDHTSSGVYIDSSIDYVAKEEDEFPILLETDDLIEIDG